MRNDDYHILAMRRSFVPWRDDLWLVGRAGSVFTSSQRKVVVESVTFDRNKTAASGPFAGFHFHPMSSKRRPNLSKPQSRNINISPRATAPSTPKPPKRPPQHPPPPIKPNPLLLQQPPLLPSKLALITPMSPKPPNTPIRAQNPMARDFRGERVVSHGVANGSRTGFVRGRGDVVREGLVGAPLAAGNLAQEGEGLFAEGG